MRSGFSKVLIAGDGGSSKTTSGAMMLRYVENEEWKNVRKNGAYAQQRVELEYKA
jgi:hypothetical protein